MRVSFDLLNLLFNLLNVPFNILDLLRRKLINDLVAHKALLWPSTSTHHTSLFDELAVESYNPESSSSH